MSRKRSAGEIVDVVFKDSKYSCVSEAEVTQNPKDLQRTPADITENRVKIIPIKTHYMTIVHALLEIKYCIIIVLHHVRDIKRQNTAEKK